MLREYVQTIIEAQQVLKEHIAATERSYFLNQKKSNTKTIQLTDNNCKLICFPT